MEMTSRERVLTALRLAETDRVPHCELFVDVAMAEKLLNQKLGSTATGGSVRSNPYTAEQAKAVARKLSHDNIGFILRAQDYAQMKIGRDGRAFPGDGLIKTEADLAMIDLPDPTKDEFRGGHSPGPRVCGSFTEHLGQIFDPTK